MWERKVEIADVSFSVVSQQACVYGLHFLIFGRHIKLFLFALGQDPDENRSSVRSKG